MQHFSQTRYLIPLALLVFLCALILRLSYVYSMEIDYPFRGDAGKYLRLALNIVERDSYSLADASPFTPSTLISPGYPALLSVILQLADNIGEFYKQVLVLQALLSSLTVLLIFFVALRVGGLASATLTGLLVAISPHLIIGSGYVLTETLSSFLIASSLAALILAFSRGGLALFMAGGVLLALAAYVRPAILLFPIALLLLAWRSHRNVKNCLATVVTVAVIWSPWQIWQSQHRHADEVSLAAASLALGGYPDLVFKDPSLKAYPYREDTEYDAMAKSVQVAAVTIGQRAAAEPLKFLTWYLFGKPLMYWQAEEVAGPGGPYVYLVTSSVYSRQAIPAATLNGMMAAHPVLVFLMVCAWGWSALDLYRKRSSPATRPAWLICVALTVYFTLLHSVLAPLPRYAFPIYPVAYTLAISFITGLVKQLKERADENL